MKKLLLMAAAIVLIMVSCIDSNDTAQDDGLNAGRTIYQMAGFQNDYAMDMFYKAMKLNILLTEARKADQYDFEKLSVQYGNKTVNLLSTLLPGAEIETDSEGTYRIVYDSKNQDGGIPYGAIVVQTGDILFEEMEDQQSGWKVSVDSEGFRHWLISSNNFTLMTESGEVFITSTGQKNKWNINITDFVSYSPESAAGVKSSWEGSFTYMLVSGGEFTYENYMESVFALDGYARGTTFSSGHSMIYNISEPLSITPACGELFVANGRIGVGFDPSVQLPEKEYPARDAEIYWVKSTALDCTSTPYINYNGKTAKY